MYVGAGGSNHNYEPGINCSKSLIVHGIRHELIKIALTSFIFLHPHTCEKEDSSLQEQENIVYKKLYH